jgi:crotonobetainyl-CoA:carnitine CoA-transferase CaiB-like acyl-CoA transferase
MKPLDHIHVVDLSRILAGPYCSMMLGDMGAEVIKIEPVEEGDGTRGWGPPFLQGESAYFLSVNRNKKSLTLDLKQKEGQYILKELIQRSDVVLENFRPGTLDKLGFGYETVRELNPRVVYCSISGFGHTGPYKNKPGFDVVLQGEGGIMSLTGDPDGPPMKVGVAQADMVSGMLAFHGILLALLVRERTGKGQKVDISMLDGQVALLSYQAGIYFATGKVPMRKGNQHPTIAPYETFEAADGYINVAVGTEGLWAKFCEVMGRSTLKDDPRFRKNADRIQNHKELNTVLDPLFKEKRVAEWIVKLEAVGIPCGQIKNVAEVCQDPQVLAREMVASLPHPTIGEVRMTGIPIKLSDTPGALESPPPLLGQHTEEVLQRVLGYRAEDIQLLREKKVI